MFTPDFRPYLADRFSFHFLPQLSNGVRLLSNHFEGFYVLRSRPKNYPCQTFGLFGLDEALLVFGIFLLVHVSSERILSEKLS